MKYVSGFIHVEVVLEGNPTLEEISRTLSQMHVRFDEYKAEVVEKFGNISIESVDVKDLHIYDKTIIMLIASYKSIS